MLDEQYIGQTLLKRGFKDFFLYLFSLIENRKFIVEPIHNDLFNMVDDILNMRQVRLCCGIAPRSAKTTICKWLIIYAWTINPKCNFIYTSYSQSLLATISSEIANILEHPIYKAMYPNRLIYKEDINSKPIDSFWEDYLRNEEGKNLYSTKKITTYAGGTCIFQSKGGQLTGQGAGIRNTDNTDTFSGGIILDDFDKPSEITSKTLREKSYRYFDETLLSRLNNPNCFILNVQQRLHIEDITGYLTEKYKFKIIKKPLLDENGVCQIPSQYTKERIEELQLNNYMFQAQYQQEPILNGGNIIKTSWFKYYQNNKDYGYKRVLITADTAMKVKQHNDYSVFIVGGVTQDNKLHIIDMVRGKWEAPELRKIALDLYNKHKVQNRTGVICSGLYVEDKASGTGLIQEFKRVGIPIHALKCDTDKLSRVESVLNYIANGNVLLPNDEKYGFNPDLLKECSEFSRDDSHAHDDICLIGNTKIATLFGDKLIKDIKVGDYVLTPYGLNKVIKSECTGEHKVIDKLGLIGTEKHKIFANGVFDKLGNLKDDVKIDTLTYDGLIKWKYKKLLSSIESNIDLWGREGIISLNQIQMLDEKVQKDYTLRFGNFIAERKYQKAISFTIKTATISITTFLIWNVYQKMNIIKNTLNLLLNFIKDLNKLNTLQKSENLQKNGTQAKKENNGIKNTLKTLWLKKDIKKRVQNVENNLKLADKEIFVNDVKINYIKENLEKNEKDVFIIKNMKKFVLYVVKHLQLYIQERSIVQRNASKNLTEFNIEKVYNITVDKAQTYYANNILVSNCDALTYCIQEALAKNNVSLLDFFME